MNIEVIDENLIDLALQEEALNLAKKKAKWNANRALLSGIANALTKLQIEPTLQNDYLSVSCSGDKHKLAAVIRILRISGFSTIADRPKQGDSSWYAWFDSDGCSMRVWFSFTSSVCRRIQKGTKTVEVPIYETVCGDLSEPKELPECTTARISETGSTPALTQTEASF